MSVIRFKFAPEKAVAAIHWMVSQRSDVDLHAALKSCYFADVEMLNRHFRPIFGATYQAMAYGPVPLEIYELIKGEPLRMAEAGLEALPWTLAGRSLRLVGNGDVDLSSLSIADRDALKSGFEKSVAMTFTERTAATHGADWQKANLGTMRYEDMIRESEQKAGAVAYLQETGRFLKL
jgi:hypothetical protein